MTTPKQTPQCKWDGKDENCSNSKAMRDHWQQCPADAPKQPPQWEKDFIAEELNRWHEVEGGVLVWNNNMQPVTKHDILSAVRRALLAQLDQIEKEMGGFSVKNEGYNYCLSTVKDLLNKQREGLKKV